MGSTVIAMSNWAWSEVFSILDLAGGWMVEERSRRPKSPSWPSANTEYEAYAIQAAQIAERYGDAVRVSTGHSGRWVTFLGEHIVVRIAKDNADALDGLHLFERILAASTLPRGPVILECDAAAGFLVERRHRGYVLDQVWLDMSDAARVRAGDDVLAFREELAEMPVDDDTLRRAVIGLNTHIQEVFGANLAPWAVGCLHGKLQWRHADLHAENLLVDPETGELQAVVDWEWVKVSVAPVDQVRLYAVAAYQVGMSWAAKVAGPITPGALIAAFGLQCIPRGYVQGTHAFYDAILTLAGRFAVEDVY